jgi:hypothetical protein
MTIPANSAVQPNHKRRLWLGRFFIAVVVFLNLQAAVAFVLHPGDYASGFEISGVAGNAMVQGMGLLFVMWNIPYIVALLHPVRYRISLIEAICMQTIGVAGETSLKLLLPASHTILIASVNRFILFDAADLFFLLLAWTITRKINLQK